MWWNELDLTKEKIVELSKQTNSSRYLLNDSLVSKGVIIDEKDGPVLIDKDAIICENVVIKGPVFIGKHSLIGNNAFIRGSTYIGDNPRIGFCTEIKNSIIDAEVTIGPQCFVADSKIESNVYMGAQVRTSNHRLDKTTIKVCIAGQWYETGKEKLGCHIQKNTALGVQVVILPGRIVEENSMFGPKILIEKNFPAGKYLLKQQISKLEG